MRSDYPLRSAGTAYDYLLFTQSNNSLKVDHHKRINEIDLGDVGFSHTTLSGGREGFYRNFEDAKIITGSNVIPNFLSDEYTPTPYNSNWEDLNVSTYSLSKAQFIFINNAYNNSSDFRQAMVGEKFLYELAEEVVTDVTSYFPADFDTLLDAEGGGTITFEQTGGTEIPIPNSTDSYIKVSEALAS